MTTRVEQIHDATLYLGDCRVAKAPKRKPWCKTPIKEVAACRACHWSWRPSSGFGHERCPRCGKVRDVRARDFSKKANIPRLKEYLAKNPRSSGETERAYRLRAVMLVGRGEVRCVRCACDRRELLEINHKNGGGGKELRATKGKFYRAIATLKRSVDDLELLCRPCNAVHALELKYGPLPFTVVWGKQ